MKWKQVAYITKYKDAKGKIVFISTYFTSIPVIEKEASDQ